MPMSYKDAIFFIDFKMSFSAYDCCFLRIFIICYQDDLSLLTLGWLLNAISDSNYCYIQFQK